jgi:hypothetical protein
MTDRILTGKCFCRFALILFALSLLIVSFHFHSNLLHDPKCTVCKAGHDLGCGAIPAPASIPLPLIAKARFVTEVPQTAGILVPPDCRSRAPPPGCAPA